MLQCCHSLHSVGAESNIHSCRARHGDGLVHLGQIDTWGPQVQRNVYQIFTTHCQPILDSLSSQIGSQKTTCIYAYIRGMSTTSSDYDCISCQPQLASTCLNQQFYVHRTDHCTRPALAFFRSSSGLQAFVPIFYQSNSMQFATLAQIFVPTWPTGFVKCTFQTQCGELVSPFEYRKPYHMPTIVGIHHAHHAH